MSKLLACGICLFHLPLVLLYVAALVIVSSDAPEFDDPCILDTGQGTTGNRTRWNLIFIWIAIGLFSLLAVTYLVVGIVSCDCGNPECVNRLTKMIRILV